MEYNILNEILNIGFKYINSENTEVGQTIQYKYYPNYFNDVHYTLTISTAYPFEYTDYILSINNNFDGSIVRIPFQLKNVDNIFYDFQNGLSMLFNTNNRLNKLFEKEILQYKRINKLNRILGE